MASFRRVFSPTPEEQILDLEMLLQLHMDQIGHCSTCENLIPGDMPGFVTDYGSCRVGSLIFAEKVCGLRDEVCPMYKEVSVAQIKREIEHLKQERSPEGEEDRRGAGN